MSKPIYVIVPASSEALSCGEYGPLAVFTVEEECVTYLFEREVNLEYVYSVYRYSDGGWENPVDVTEYFEELLDG